MEAATRESGEGLEERWWKRGRRVSEDAFEAGRESQSQRGNATEVGWPGWDNRLSTPMARLFCLLRIHNSVSPVPDL